MNLKQISTLINEKIVPNLFGQGEDVSHNPITIAEDLRNVVDVGTALASLTAAQLKDYMQTFAVGVIETFFDSRSYKDETYDFYLSEQLYGGAVQRCKAKLLKATDTPILTLDNAYNPAGGAGNEVDYTDGRFWGTVYDNKLYTDDIAFQIKWSLATTMFQKSFMDAASVQKLVAMIEANVENTLRMEMNGVARGLIIKMIQSAYSGNRKIDLITKYNTIFNYSSGDAGYVTLATWKQDTNFKLWCEEVIIQLRKSITDYNEKYNDGTIATFTPEEDARTLLLGEFATALDFAQSSVYHSEMTSIGGNYRTINFWQNSTKDMLPQIASGSLHDQVKVQTGEDTTVTVNHVVGLIYDRFTAFFTTKLKKTTEKYVPEGDFVTFFHTEALQLAIDERATCLILTLN